ncbi:methionine ABC transporter permease [Streptomyces boluensis]|uniref:Methionine ABC transporter permease MetI n=1 Tax=Streptomyces boluensis TaxID=1775135 RepID=A0A964UKR5_9ACTN|nr:methionine ABC transporter permease [Streptomyces boluensis]NBE50914.1 methionine ABC transporter permease MetI [Streptomyces boluensis]
MTWSEMQPLLSQACWDTFYMVAWSTLIAVVGGLPLGLLLVLTDRGGLLQNVVANKVIGQIVNIARSMPFIILMVALMGFTRAIVGTTIGVEAAIVPLAVGAIPFFARLVETAVREVDGGLVEAVQSMGGNTWTVVRKVLVPESLPSLISATTTTIVALIGYSAMAGTVGAGGLGDIAIRYGYQRFESSLMWITVAVLAVVISLIQFAGDSGARVLHRRAGKGGEPLRFRAFTGLLPGGPVASESTATAGSSAKSG